MRLPALTIVLAVAACDASVRVGELREDPIADSAVPQADAATDATTPELSWKLHAPMVPCTIYAMGEARADQLYAGCNGGRIYRFDGVRAYHAFSAEEAGAFSLLWVAPTGEVVASAQRGRDEHGVSTLFRFDGTSWTPLSLPGAPRRVTSIAGSDAANVWVATDKEIFRLEGGRLQPVHQVTAGAIRACAFFAADRGFCTGTGGLALAWDGKAWSPVTGAPWSSRAEIFGVEVESGRSVFFYGEPISHANGNHECKVARYANGAFTSDRAGIPCFAGFELARKRTGSVIAGARAQYLLSPDDAFGGALLFDLAEDTVTRLCGPALAFSSGSANTRAGGLYGLLGTFIGAGGNQIAIAPIGGSELELADLSVGADGTAWARTQDTTACGSVTERLVRFEQGSWRAVAGPQGALSGRGLAAVARDRAYTVDLFTDSILEHEAGIWTPRAEVKDPWSLFAAGPGDVWIGSTREGVAHWDGKKVDVLVPSGKLRQVEQIVAADKEVWYVVQGVTAGDTDRRIVRLGGGEWNVGLERARIAVLDATHAWRSGAPARAWDGTTWKALPFEAHAVWARSPGEVYFTQGGDILRYDGRKAERVYHGLIPIDHIGGSKDRGFAVGPGGLTIELARWPGDVR